MLFTAQQTSENQEDGRPMTSAISLPKGGEAISSIGEKLATIKEEAYTIHYYRPRIEEHSEGTCVVNGMSLSLG